MKTLFLSLFLCLIAFGCREIPQEYHETGYVRSLWCREDVCNVIFETDQGSIHSIPVLNGIPPVWIGLHAEVSYREYWAGRPGYYEHFQVIKRLP